jgi:transcription elongation GreA/GreB family factor
MGARPHGAGEPRRRRSALATEEATMNDTLITRDGLEKLQAELAALRTERGEDEELLERRIAVLEQRLAAATVVDPDGRNGCVDVGERVTVRNLDSGEVLEYRLVGTLEAAPAEGRISVVSPLGQALLGCRIGDTAIVDAPKGRLQFEVVSIAEAPVLGGRARPAA